MAQLFAGMRDPSDGARHGKQHQFVARRQAQRVHQHRQRIIDIDEFAGRLGDPRAHALLQALARAGTARKLTGEIPERIAEATGEFVNIDYALAVLVHTLGLPPGNELVLFAMARTVGWIAHASEQLRHGGLIRPRARYIGPAPGRSPAFNRP